MAKIANDPFSTLAIDPEIRHMDIQTTSIYPRSINDSEQGGSASWIFPRKGTLSRDTRVVLPAVCAQKCYQYPINCGVWALIEKATFSTSNGSVFAEVSKAGEIYHMLNLTTGPEKNLNVTAPLSGINYNFETGSGSKLTNDPDGMENLAGQYRLICDDYKEKKPSVKRSGRLGCRPNCLDGQSPSFLLETDENLTQQLSIELSRLFPGLYGNGEFELPLFALTDSLILDLYFTKDGPLGSNDRAIYLPELNPNDPSSITCVGTTQVGACVAKKNTKDQILSNGSGTGSGLRLLVDFGDDEAGTMENVRVLDGGSGYVDMDVMTFTNVYDYASGSITLTPLDTNLIVTPGCIFADWSSDANFHVPASLAGADFVEGNEYVVKHFTNSNQNFKIKAVSVNTDGGLVECTLADKQTNDNLCIPIYVDTAHAMLVYKTDGTTDSGARLMVNVSVTTLAGDVTGAVPNGSLCSTADGTKVALVTELTDAYITEVVMEKGTLAEGDVFVLTAGNSFEVKAADLKRVFLTGTKQGANLAPGDLLYNTTITKGIMVVTVDANSIPNYGYVIQGTIEVGDVLKKMKEDETLEDGVYMTVGTVIDRYLNVTTSVEGEINVSDTLKTDGNASTLRVEKTVNGQITQVVHYTGAEPQVGDSYFPVDGAGDAIVAGDTWMDIVTVGEYATIPNSSSSKIPVPQLGLDPIHNFDDLDGQKIKILTDKCFIATDLIYRMDGTEDIIGKAVMGKGLPHVYTQFENSTFTLTEEPTQVNNWGDKETIPANRLIGLSNNVVRNIMFMVQNSGTQNRPDLPYYKKPKVNPLLSKYHSRCSLAENGFKYQWEINSLPHYNSGPVESDFRAFRELCKCKGNMFLNKAMYSAWNNARQLDNEDGELSDANPSLQPGFVEPELNAAGNRMATPKHQINERKAGMSNQGYYGVNQACLRGMNNYHGTSFKLHRNGQALGNGIAVGNQSVSMELYQDATYDPNYSGSCTLSVHSEVERSLLIQGGEIHVSTASF